jgi:hypothetical protein
MVLISGVGNQRRIGWNGCNKGRELVSIYQQIQNLTTGQGGEEGERKGFGGDGIIGWESANTKTKRYS